MRNVLVRLALGALMMGSAACMAAPEAGFVRFEFSRYDGEGTFVLFRTDVNVQSGKVHFCFLDSNAARNPKIDELAGPVYRGEPWTGHYDLDGDKGTLCFDTELAGGRQWFATAAPVHTGMGAVQFYFTGTIQPDKAKRGRYLMDGTLVEFEWQPDMRPGMRSYASEVRVRERNVK
jgi:hypothetical protein